MVDFSRLPMYLGPVTASPAAMDALAAANQTALGLLIRHAAGDWGEADDEERAANWLAITSGQELVCGVYRLTGGVKVFIVTEMAPRQTSILLAEEA